MITQTPEGMVNKEFSKEELQLHEGLRRAKDRPMDEWNDRIIRVSPFWKCL